LFISGLGLHELWANLYQLSGILLLSRLVGTCCSDVYGVLVTLTPLVLHPFSGLFSRTAWVCQYKKGKTSLDLNEARDDGAL